MTKKSTSSNYVAIVTVERNDYRIHFWVTNKSKALNEMRNVGLSEKSGQL